MIRYVAAGGNLTYRKMNVLKSRTWCSLIIIQLSLFIFHPPLYTNHIPTFKEALTWPSMMSSHACPPTYPHSILVLFYIMSLTILTLST